jgi:RNA polymerase sigma-70 factor, ECF subfamily
MDIALDIRPPHREKTMTQPRSAGPTTAVLDPVAAVLDPVAKFDRYVTPLASTIFRSACYLTKNRQDAEDLTQEAMLRAFAGIGSLREGSNESAWMSRILRNTWIDQHRKKQRRPNEQCVGDFTDHLLASPEAPVSKGLRSAEIEALEFLPDQKVKAALDALPESLRMVVYYADVAGMSCKEIAAAMNTPIGTVVSRLHRGRRRLRSTLTMHHGVFQAASRRPASSSASGKVSGLTVRPART